MIIQSMFDMIMLLDELSYDKYVIEGSIGAATCRLWRVGESESSICRSSSSPELAMAEALSAVRALELPEIEGSGLDNVSAEAREEAIFKRVSEAIKEEILASIGHP